MRDNISHVGSGVMTRSAPLGLCGVREGLRVLFETLRCRPRPGCAHRVTFLRCGRAWFIIAKVPLIVAALTSLLVLVAPNASAQSEQLPTVLFSRQLATAEGLRVGDIVTLAGKADGSSARRFRVAGIYEPVADPMRLAAQRFEARLHLPDLLSLAAD